MKKVRKKGGGGGSWLMYETCKKVGRGLGLCMKSIRKEGSLGFCIKSVRKEGVLASV